MVQPLISVIIPVYNVEPYLEKCLKSILAQTYPNFEVLAVNDGSTDGCAAILEAFATKDRRLHVFTQENSGVSAARNLGLDRAAGEYIAFLDSDDWVEPKFLQTLYTCLTKYEADISICNIHYIYADGSFGKRTPKILEEAVVDTREAYSDLLLEEKFRSHVYNKLYKAELFSDLRFPAMPVHEDSYIMFPLFSRAKRVAYTPFYGYYYLQRRPNSLLTTCFNENRFLLFTSIDHALPIAKALGLETEHRAFTFHNVVSLCNHLVNCYANLSRSQKKDYCSRVRSALRTYGSPKGNPYISKVTRFRLFLISHCFPLYVVVYKLIKKLGI